MIKHLEKTDNFETETQTKCLVDFYADWCGPCKMMGTILESSEEKINIPIIKVNSDVHNELSIKMGVMSIPTLILMENGKEIKRHVGVMNESELLEFIK